uniref:DYW domain-containing protein n=1 Tax=Fagus sylvatica TaxID=28930 RepID=A0A2N9HG18_FAGSY
MSRQSHDHIFQGLGNQENPSFKASTHSNTSSIFHAHLLRFGLNQDNYLLNFILRHALHFGHTHYTRLLFHQTTQPNIYLWNTLIRGFVSNDCFHDAIHYYALMRTQGFLPNSFTFPFVLKACARLLDVQLGVKIHTLVVKSGFDYDVYVKTSLLCLYAHCGYLGHAHKVFDEIPEKNVVSWTAIISGYIGVGQYREAIDMFRMLVEMGLRPDGFTIVRVLFACTQLGDLRSGEWIDGYMTEIGMGRNVFVATSLVDMYAKCGNMEKARCVFDGIVEKDIVTWSTMIQTYALNGFPKEALDLFFQMQRENLKPDRYAMVGVLSACARLGALELGDWASGMMDRTWLKLGKSSEGMKEKDRVVWNAIISGLAMNGHVKAVFGLFGQIEKTRIQPDGNTFIGLLCGCTHAGLVDDGRQYFNSMNRVFSLTPTIEHYGCMVDLLGQCRLHRDTALAEYILKKLIELEPWNSGNYVLLSNIYSTSHRWDEAAKLRSSMNEKRMKKIPGCSWIEVDGVVHEFLVGDKSHPLSEKIYAKLDELAKELKAAGYVPSTDFVLFDIEEEEKEHFLGCHSEKLAIAFGLISTSPKDVIRVVKNLRETSDWTVPPLIRDSFSMIGSAVGGTTSAFYGFNHDPVTSDVIAPSPWTIFGCQKGLQLFKEAKDRDMSYCITMRQPFG